MPRIKATEIWLRLARGAFWAIVGALIARGLMLVALILIARMLGVITYGELGIIRSTVGMFSVFAGFGLGLTATKHVAEFRHRDPERTGRIIHLSGMVASVTGGVIASGLFVFAPWLAEYTINAPHLSGELRIGALLLFMNALNGAQNGALTGFEAFRTIAHVNLIVGLISFPVLICSAYFGGLTGVVWALVINLCINWWCNRTALRKEANHYNVPYAIKCYSDEWPVIWKFSLPAALSSSMMGPINWICCAMLVNTPNGYGSMGIFSAAIQWREAILLVPGMLGQVILPLLSSAQGDFNSREYRKILGFNVSLNVGFALLVVIPMLVLSHRIMSAYGASFVQGITVFRVFAVTSVVIAFDSVTTHAIVSSGRMWLGFFFNALWAVALMSMSSVLLQRGYGATGLAWANCFAYSCRATCQGCYVIINNTENK